MMQGLGVHDENRKVKRRRIIIIILILFIACLVIFFPKPQKDPLAEFIKNTTDYEVLECINENGEIDVMIECSTEESHEILDYRVQIVLYAIQHHPRRVGENKPKEVTLRLYSKEDNVMIMRVTVKGKKFLATPWGDTHSIYIRDKVDYYYYYRSIEYGGKF